MNTNTNKTILATLVASSLSFNALAEKVDVVAANQATQKAITSQMDAIDASVLAKLNAQNERVVELNGVTYEQDEKGVWAVVGASALGLTAALLSGSTGGSGSPDDNGIPDYDFETGAVPDGEGLSPTPEQGPITDFIIFGELGGEIQREGNDYLITMVNGEQVKLHNVERTDDRNVSFSSAGQNYNLHKNHDGKFWIQQEQGNGTGSWKTIGTGQDVLNNIGERRGDAIYGGDAPVRGGNIDGKLGGSEVHPDIDYPEVPGVDNKPIAPEVDNKPGTDDTTPEMDVDHGWGIVESDGIYGGDAPVRDGNLDGKLGGSEVHPDIDYPEVPGVDNKPIAPEVDNSPILDVDSDWGVDVDATNPAEKPGVDIDRDLDGSIDNGVGVDKERVGTYTFNADEDTIIRNGQVVANIVDGKIVTEAGNAFQTYGSLTLKGNTFVRVADNDGVMHVLKVDANGTITDETGSITAGLEDRKANWDSLTPERQEIIKERVADKIQDLNPSNGAVLDGEGKPENNLPSLDWSRADIEVDLDNDALVINGTTILFSEDGDFFDHQGNPLGGLSMNGDNNITIHDKQGNLVATHVANIGAGNVFVHANGDATLVGRDGKAVTATAMQIATVKDMKANWDSMTDSQKAIIKDRVADKIQDLNPSKFQSIKSNLKARFGK